MKNNKYWLSRAVRRMFERMAKAEKTANIVAKIYKKALLYLLGKQEGIFKKYMVKYGLTMTEAKRLLNTMRDKTSVDELMQKLNEAKSSKERQELKKELETAAYRARLERLQNLQDQIDDVMQTVFKQEKEVTTEHYIDLAEETYNETMYDVQQETGLGFSFAQIDPKQIKRMLNVNWSGSNYASRIWGNTRKLAQRLKEELIVSVITGRTERDTAEIFKEEFARGASDARRLIRTESSYISSQIEMESYKECEIEQYRYLATLDLRTSKVCRELDGKVFPVSEQKPGKNCPPMHPWCRSTTTAVVSEEAFQKMKRRARDPKTGKTYTVPASMTYKEWYSKYVEGNQKAETKNKKKAETKGKTEAKEKATLNHSADRKQYEKYREILGEDAPKNFADFQKMKYNTNEYWKYIEADYQRRLELKKNPELKLPNAEDAILAEAKFTKYLFNPDNTKGYPKGMAFTERLGYGMDNWEKLQEEIRQAAVKFPAHYVSNNGYGDRYVQRMILYGVNGKPANVIAAWIKKQDGTVSLTSAYIKELQ